MTGKYAEGSRQEGEISVSEAAELLGAHKSTLWTWAREAVSGGRSRVKHVRRDLFGRYWFQKSEILALSMREPEELY